MKKVFLLSTICLMLSAFMSFGQTQTFLRDSMDFESGVLPERGWTVSGQTAPSTTVHSPTATQGKSWQLIPNQANDDTLKSPVYYIGPGKYARLEFSHIPMLATATTGGQVIVRHKDNEGWHYTKLPYGNNATSDPSCYDRAYGKDKYGAFVGTSQYNMNNPSFFAACYSDYPQQNTPPSTAYNAYW
ncbi:MAG: hypothetical protein LBO06_06205, partial [Bacteroidales bacterium]|nr:hypothetical protein [Bacteroidales bacterium]